MSSPLFRYKETTLMLPPVLCGSIGYYALMACHRNVVVDGFCRYDKRRKIMHRFDIADVNGRLTLTVPIVKPHKSRATWNDVAISTHGQWWNIHKVALWSAYGRTPFFEYYIDEFMPFLQNPNNDNSSLMEFNKGIDRVIRRIARIESNVEYLSDDIDNSINIEKISKIKDCRFSDFALSKSIEYYQVRARQHGFISNLSILDLIFNMGPETPLVLKKIIDENYY